jgi:predicted DNA-binding protein (UPF0251 family)
MNKLQWRTEPATALATLLKQATLEQSAAIGTSTLYHIIHEGRQKLAISLPDGQALIIESGNPAIIRRRRVDPPKSGATED